MFEACKFGWPHVRIFSSVFSSVKGFVNLKEIHPAVTNSRGTASIEQETLGSDDGPLLAAVLRPTHSFSFSFSFLLHVKQSLGVSEVRDDTRCDGSADGGRILSP